MPDLFLFLRQEDPRRKAAKLLCAFSFSLAKEKSWSAGQGRKNVGPVWYWVDTYSNRFPYEAKKMPDGSSVSPFPDSETGVYGFGRHPDTATEEDFLKLIQAGLDQKGKYEGEYKRIYDYLRKDKPAPQTSDVRIWGVVVTGTAEHLKALKGKPYLKAAVFGTIADRY
ncbi:anti sigma factor C-terminal domain-containing protein [Paenibacillus sp. D51F]